MTMTDGPTSSAVIKGIPFPGPSPEEVPLIGPPAPPMTPPTTGLSSSEIAFSTMRDSIRSAIPDDAVNIGAVWADITNAPEVDRPRAYDRSDRLAVQDSQLPMFMGWEERCQSLAWEFTTSVQPPMAIVERCTMAEWDAMAPDQQWDLFKKVHHHGTTMTHNATAWRERAWIFAKVVRRLDASQHRIVAELKKKLLQRYEEIESTGGGCSGDTRRTLQGWMPYELAPTTEITRECHSCGNDSEHTVATIYQNHSNMSQYADEVDDSDIEYSLDWDNA